MTTLTGTKRKAIRVSGFRARLKSKTGKKILKNRRLIGRKRLALK